MLNIIIKMKINIKNKVIECEDIEFNIKKFLLLKSKNQPIAFLPFEVQKVSVTPKQPKSLVDCRNMYRTAYSQKRSQPNYMTPLRRNTRQLINLPNAQINQEKKKSIHVEQAYLQSFYANQIMGEKRIKTADDKNHRYRLMRFIIPKSLEQNIEDQYMPNQKFLGYQKQNERKYSHRTSVKNNSKSRSIGGLSIRLGDSIVGVRRKKVKVDNRNTLQFSLNGSTNQFEFNFNKKFQN